MGIYLFKPVISVSPDIEPLKTYLQLSSEEKMLKINFKSKCVETQIWTNYQFNEAEFVMLNLNHGNQFAKLDCEMQKMLTQISFTSTKLINTSHPFLIHRMPYQNLYISLLFSHTDNSDIIHYYIHIFWSE